MTWFGFRNIFDLTRSAAIIAALSFSGASAIAQQVLLQSPDGGVAVSGAFLAYDGELLTLRTEMGVTSLRMAGMACDGDACPGDTYVPTLRLSGAVQLSDLVLPALAEAYARDSGMTISGADDVLVLSDSQGPRLHLDIRHSTASAGFEALLVGEVDMVLSAREFGRDELQQARLAGLGDLANPRQSRIVALDALVPITGAGSTQRDISLRVLADALSGQISDWSQIDGAQDGPIHVHLLGPEHGVTDAMLERYLFARGSQLAGSVTWHQTPEALEDAVNEQPGALGLLPFARLGTSQPLALSGTCGVRANARFLSLKTEDYPLTFPLYLYAPGWRQHPEIRQFLNWMRGASAQLVVRRAGLADLAGVPIPLSDQGQRLANAISSAGEEVSLTELQRMVRVLSPRVRISNTFRFQPGSTRLDGPSQSNVMLLAQAIRNGEYTGRELLLVGFSDGRGPALANRDLSSARAEAVRRDVLQALGGTLPFNVTLDTEAFGEAMPIACDDSLWGQQTNRRVELWVRDLDGN